MEAWNEHLKTILDRAPTRAMPLSTLVQSLNRLGGSQESRKDLVIKAAGSQQESYRIIPNRLGPWAQHPKRRRSLSPVQPENGWEPDPWVLTWSGPRGLDGPQGRMIEQLTDSLGAWGKEVDVGSPSSVARWIGANREAERALKCLTTSGRNPA